jgi:hypothetical protein
MIASSPGHLPVEEASTPSQGNYVDRRHPHTPPDQAKRHHDSHRAHNPPVGIVGFMVKGS